MIDYKNAFDFSGKVALVTGAGGSIGREIAKGFALCGANVVVADVILERANETLKELELVENGHIAVKCDVTDISSINMLVETTCDKFGRIDFLSNHAGLNIRKPAVDFSEEDWDTVCNINLKGNFFVAQAVGKKMIERNYGKIVNTASVSAKRGHPNLAVYAATKGGISQLTKVLANEWAKNGINVNAIGPGYVRTNQTASLLADEERYNKMISLIPMGRFGEISDMVGTVLFLCSDTASYITGQTIYVEGGRTID